MVPASPKPYAPRVGTDGAWPLNRTGGHRAARATVTEPCRAEWDRTGPNGAGTGENRAVMMGEDARKSLYSNDLGIFRP